MNSTAVITRGVGAHSRCHAARSTCGDASAVSGRGSDPARIGEGHNVSRLASIRRRRGRSQVVRQLTFNQKIRGFDPRRPHPASRITP